MSFDRNRLDADAVDRVMSQVLAAEREARTAVEGCRAEAARILSTAQEDARRLAHRTERRIALAHRIADQAVERALQEMQDSRSGAESAAPGAELRGLVELVVDDLVDEILYPKP